MGGNYFDQIAKEILQQKRLLDDLHTENRMLHRQLADLRSGRGIFIEIQQQRFALLDSEEAIALAPVQPLSEESPIRAVTTNTVSSESTHRKEEIPAPIADTKASVQLENAPVHTSTFLEEVLLDEFSSALTSPVATTTNLSKQEEPINEEQKASLRQELMGSFLLE